MGDFGHRVFATSGTDGSATGRNDQNPAPCSDSVGGSAWSLTLAMSKPMTSTKNVNAGKTFARDMDATVALFCQPNQRYESQSIWR